MFFAHSAMKASFTISITKMSELALGLLIKRYDTQLDVTLIFKTNYLFDTQQCINFNVYYI